MAIEDDARTLDECCTGVPSAAFAGFRLHGLLNVDPDQPGLALLAEVMTYTLLDRRQQEQRQRWSSPFCPYLVMEAGCYPRPLDELSLEDLKDLASAAELVTHPLARARVGDVLWERRHPPARGHAARAFASYLVLAARDAVNRVDDLYRAQHAERAAEIAMRLNSTDLRTQAAAALIDVGTAALQSKDPGFGVIGRVLDALLRFRHEDQPPAVDALIEQAERVHGADPDAVEQLFDLRARRAGDDSEAVRDIRRRQVHARLRVAEDSESTVLRRAHLERAAVLLQLHSGSRDDRHAVARAIEDAEIDPSELALVSAEVSIPIEEVHAFIEEFAGQSTWTDALTAFGTYGPPTGDVARNQTAADEAAHAGPLLALIPKIVESPEGLPIRRIVTGEQQAAYRLVQAEAFELSFWRGIAPAILQRIFAAHGCPARGELRHFFATAHIDEAAADGMARAVEHFHAGDHDEAVAVIMPRLERAIRALARAAGLAVFAPPGEKDGKVASLGEILQALRPIGLPDESWWRYGWHLLSEPLGGNLRNRFSHGLMERGREDDAALLIHLACHLRLLTTDERQERESPEL